MFLASGGFLLLLFVAFWLFTLFDAVTAPEEKIRGLQKPLWILVILLFFFVGSVLYWIFGRPRASAGGAGPKPAFGGFGGLSQRPARGRSVAPDDDPDFLRSLNPPRDGNDPTR